MSSSSFISALSRRGILKGLAAVLATPAAAENINVPSGDIFERPESVPDENAFTIEEQFKSCMAQLHGILARMHPGVSVHHPYYLASREDGSYRLSIQGDVEFQPYQGDGIYLVSIDGWPWEYLVREEPVITLSGKSLGWSRYFGRARADDGGWDDFERMISPTFVRKLGEVSL